MYLLVVCCLLLLHCFLLEADQCEDGKERWVNQIDPTIDIPWILDLHNSRRQEVASGKCVALNDQNQKAYLPKAKNMRKMSWCEDCAVLAQKQADKCVFAHGNTKNGTKQYGQSLSGIYRTRKELVTTRNWTFAIYNLYNEKDLFHYGDIRNFLMHNETGHFSALAWANSSGVGCGFVAFENKTDEFRAHSIYVCNYYTPGNWAGQNMYEEGEPCKTCTCGDPKYPALCTDVPK